MVMKKKNEIKLYPLEKIKFMIKDACQLDIAYAYDDLVFAEHGLFLVKFEDNEGISLSCWFNNEIQETEEIRIFDSLARTAALNNAVITYKGRFSMKQKVGSEEIDIEFVDI